MRYTLVIFWILLLVPSIVVPIFEISDNFNYRSIAYVKYYQSWNKLPLFKNTDFTTAIGGGARVHPLHELFFRITELVLNLDATFIQFLPLGIVIVLVYYITLKRIMPSTKLIYIALFHISYSIFQAPIAGTYIQTFGYVYLLSIMFFLYVMFKAQSLSFLPLTILTIVALNFMYYTNMVIVALLVFSLTCIFLIMEFKQKGKSFSYYRKITFFLFTITIILFIYNHIVYSSLLKLLRSNIEEYIAYALKLYSSKILGLISKDHLTKEAPSTTFEYVMPINFAYSIMNMLRVFVLLGLFSYITFKMTKKLLVEVMREKSINLTMEETFLIGLIFAILISTFIYLFYGGYFRFGSLIYVGIIGILMFIKMVRSSNMKLATFFAFTFLLVSIVSCVMFIIFLYEDKVVKIPFSYREAYNAAYFIVEHEYHARSLRILSDFRTSSIYMVLLAKHGIILKPLYFDSSIYRALVKGSLNMDIVDYIIINVKLKYYPISSILWRYYEPIAKYLYAISDAYNILYANNIIILLKPLY